MLALTSNISPAHHQEEIFWSTQERKAWLLQHHQLMNNTGPVSLQSNPKYYPDNIMEGGIIKSLTPVQKLLSFCEKWQPTPP